MVKWLTFRAMLKGKRIKTKNNMITEYRSVSLSYLSTNLSLLAHLDTIATVYQRQEDTYHLVLSDVDLVGVDKFSEGKAELSPSTSKSKNLIWLEISPYRVTMTQQNQTQLNYRHFWERGVYGVSRYWLNENIDDQIRQRKMQLRNFTRDLSLTGSSMPDSLRIEYELWTNNLNFGHYILHLEIK